MQVPLDLTFVMAGINQTPFLQTVKKNNFNMKKNLITSECKTEINQLS
jgi:hypothetical protein